MVFHGFAWSSMRVEWVLVELRGFMWSKDVLLGVLRKLLMVGGRASQLERDCILFLGCILIDGFDWLHGCLAWDMEEEDERWREGLF